MADRFVHTHIKKLPMFARMTDAHLETVARAFQVLRFEPGEVVFYQGEPTQGLLLFVSGEGVLFQQDAGGQQQPIGVVRAGQFVGEPSLNREGVESATLQISQSAVILFLAREGLLNVTSHHPEVRAALHRSPAGRATEPRYPTTFPTQRDNEVVLLFRRRHWWAFGRRLWLAAFVAALFVSAAALSPSAAVTVIAVIFAVVVPGLLALYFYAEWHNDRVIITDQRVIREERNILAFSTNIAEVRLESVLGIDTAIPPRDPFARAFNYGNVVVHTPSETGDMHLDMIPAPGDIQETLFTQREHLRQSGEQRRQQVIRAELDHVFEPDAEQDGAVSNSPPGQPRQQERPSLIARLLPIEMKMVRPDGETIYRKHYLVWLRHILPPFLLLLAGGALLILSLFNVLGVGIIEFPLGFLLLFFGIAGMLWADWDWRNDMYVLTDDSITLIHRRPLWLQNEVDQVRLDRVENVVADTRGPINSLFNVGDVFVSLLGSDRDDAKTFASVHKPEAVQAEISQRQARRKAREEEAESQRHREAIADYLSAYHERVNPGEPSNPPPTYSYPPRPANAPQSDAPGRHPSPPSRQPHRPFRSGRRPGIPRRPDAR